MKAEGRNAETATLLLFLLDFDRQPGAGRFANQLSLELATEWCLEFSDEQRVQQVLSRLLWMRPSQEILRIAEAHLYQFEWTMDTTFVLTGLIQSGIPTSRLYRVFPEAASPSYFALPEFRADVARIWCRSSSGKLLVPILQSNVKSRLFLPDFLPDFFKGIQ